MFGVGALQVTFGNERSSLSALLSWIVCRSHTRTSSFAEMDLSRVPLVACSSCGAAVVYMLPPLVLVILCACRRARRHQNSVGFASWNLETLRDKTARGEPSWNQPGGNLVATYMYPWMHFRSVDLYLRVLLSHGRWCKTGTA